jgi:hypothetical protein
VQRVLLEVPMPVLVVLLAPLLYNNTNRAENTSLHICGSVQKYMSDTNHERTYERTKQLILHNPQTPEPAVGSRLSSVCPEGLHKHRLDGTLPVYFSKPSTPWGGERSEKRKKEKWRGAYGKDKERIIIDYVCVVSIITAMVNNTK